MRHIRHILWFSVLALPLLASGGEGAEAGAHGINWLQFLQQFVNAFLFFGLIYWLVRKPAREFFAGRLASIKAALEMAEHSRQEAKQRLSEIESKMQNLEAELKQIEDQAHQDAEREKQRIQEAAQKDVERLLQQAAEEVDYRKRQAIAELKHYTVALSFEQVESLLKQQLDDTTRQRLMDEFMQDVGARL